MFPRSFQDLWNNEGFLALSTAGRAVFLFLHTSPELLAFGCLRANSAGLAMAYGMPHAKFRRALAELTARGMAITGRNFIFLPWLMAMKRPESPNVARSWARAIAKIPEAVMRREAGGALVRLCQRLGAPWLAAIGMATPRSLPLGARAATNTAGGRGRRPEGQNPPQKWSRAAHQDGDPEKKREKECQAWLAGVACATGACASQDAGGAGRRERRPGNSGLPQAGLPAETGTGGACASGICAGASTGQPMADKGKAGSRPCAGSSSQAGDIAGAGLARASQAAPAAAPCEGRPDHAGAGNGSIATAAAGAASGARAAAGAAIPSVAPGGVPAEAMAAGAPCEAAGAGNVPCEGGAAGGAAGGDNNFPQHASGVVAATLAAGRKKSEGDYAQTFLARDGVYRVTEKFVAGLERKYPNARRELVAISLYLEQSRPERRTPCERMRAFIANWLERAAIAADPFAGWPEWRKEKVRQARRFLDSLSPEWQEIAHGLAGGDFRSLPCPL